MEKVRRIIAALAVAACFATPCHVMAGGRDSMTSATALADSISAIADGCPGEIGVAVITGRDTVLVGNRCVYPLMSVFKVHQALAVCGRLDREGRPLDSLLTFRRCTLDPTTWSPMLKEHLNSAKRISKKIASP